MDALAGDLERTEDDVDGAKVRHYRDVLLRTREAALAVVSLQNSTIGARLLKFFIHHKDLDWLPRAHRILRYMTFQLEYMPEGGTQEETLATEDTRRENDRLIKDNESSLDHFRARNGSHPGHECAWKVGRRLGGGRYSVLWCSHKFLGKQFIQLLNLAVARSPTELGGNPYRRRSRSPWATPWFFPANHRHPNW